MQSLRRQPRVGPIRLAPTATAAAVQCELPYVQQARGRPIHGRRESKDGGDGKPGPRLKIGAVRTRRLAVSEGVARPSGSVYGNPLRGTRESAPVRAHRRALGREDRCPRRPGLARLPRGAINDRPRIRTTPASGRLFSRPSRPG